MTTLTTEPDSGFAVPAGLTVHLEDPDGTGLHRYQLIHLDSGAVICGPATTRCATHMAEVIEIVAELGHDWTQPKATVLTGLNYMTIYDRLHEIGLCFDPETALARPCPTEEHPAHPTEGAA